jgi:protein-S-isoprenylcysteine O-methyltransferase Ste14
MKSDKLMPVFLMTLAPALAICLALLGLETLNENCLGWFLLVFGIAYPAGVVIYYFIRREPFWKSAGGGEALNRETGDHSFWLILPGFLAVFFAPPLEWLYLPAILPRTFGMQITGLVLILAALALRVWARTHIRDLYSGHVEVQADHYLVQSGPYHFARHPGYIGFLLMALGLCIGYSSLIGLIAIPVLLLPGLAYRMRAEERLLTANWIFVAVCLLCTIELVWRTPREEQMMLEAFGDGCKAYIQYTGRFLPKL